MQPIEWRGDHVLILDQRKLPREEVLFSVSDAEGMAEAISQMALRGAPLIGIAAAYGLALEAKKMERLLSLRQLEEHLKKMAEILRKTRPTAVNLPYALQRMLARIKKSALSPESLAEALAGEAFAIHEEERRACLQIGKNGALLLPKGTVLTHCNTGPLATGGEGTAYAILKEGFREGKVTHVLACEARPFLQGARLTAFELQKDKIPFTLITDFAAGHAMACGRVQAVVVGADRVSANGDVANKIGTYVLAVLARENNIPFFVACPLSTVDYSVPTGQDIPVEERNPHEVTRVMGIPTAPEGVKAMNPAFDITPASYIHALVTEKGCAMPLNSNTLLALKKGGSPVAAL